MSLRFIPPKEDAKGLPRYASYVVGSGLKVHGRIVDAKNSWRNRGWHYVETGELVERFGFMRPERKYVTKHGFILENVDGFYYTLYEIQPGLAEEELPWYKTFIRDTAYTWDKGQPLEEFNKYSYRVKHREENPTRYVEFRKPVPMSRDEYAAWRLAIQMEQIRNGNYSSDMTPAEDL
jgi:hypothetical protein